MLKTITVKDADGNDVGVPMRADASVPRLYRIKFRRDIFKDLGVLAGKMKKAKTEGDQFNALDLEMFENVSYILAKHADKTVPENPNEWLERYSMFAIAKVLPEILELWGLNMQTTSVPKKENGRPSGK